VTVTVGLDEVGDIERGLTKERVATLLLNFD
jgi:hypothetical protein